VSTIWILTSHVPSTEKINTARKEPCLEFTSAECIGQLKVKTYLEDPQDDPESHQISPLLDETHSNHDGTPENRDASEVIPRTQLTHDHRRWKLENDVRHEED